MLSRSAPAVAAPERGGPAGAKGARAATAWGSRGRVRGAVWLGWATQAVPGGRRVWRPPPLGRMSRAPRRRNRPGGGALYGARSRASVTRAPPEETPRGGAERRRGRRRGVLAIVQEPIQTRQAGRTGVRRDGRRLPAVTSPPPLTPREESITPPPLYPIPLVRPAFLLWRCGHDILAVAKSGADGGDDVPKSGGRRAPKRDGSLKCGARRAGVMWDASQVGSPNPRRRGSEPAARRRRRARPSRAVRRRRPLGRAGSPPVRAPPRPRARRRPPHGLAGWPHRRVLRQRAQWRDPEPRVVGGRESSDATATGPTPVHVNGGVGEGLSRVKCGGAVSRRERGGAYHGGRPRAVDA